jgi:hypothetical protein
LTPGANATLTLEVTNLGDAPALGESSPIVISDALPVGITATAVSGPGCSVVTPQLVRCEAHETIRVNTQVGAPVEIQVTVAAGEPVKLVNETRVSGGGAIEAVAREAIPVSSMSPTFGIEKLSATANNENGSLDTQAGSHPFELTTVIRPNQPNVKDIHFELPAGLVGNPNVLPKCTITQFEYLVPGQEDNDACPTDTAIGVAEVFTNPGAPGIWPASPVFNLEPAPGEPARFGFEIAGVPTILDASIRTGGDYGVDITAKNITQVLGTTGARVTFWGVPGALAHDASRGWACLAEQTGRGVFEPCVPPAGIVPAPFLTLPTTCGSATEMRTRAQADSWLVPGVSEAEYTPQNEAGESVGLTGCNELRFEPSLNVTPDGQQASSPTGLTADQHISQEGVLNPTGLAPSNAEDITVTLPAGVAANPAGADGLGACSEPEIGYLPGESEPPDNLRFTSGLPAPKGSPAEPFCPDAAKIGTVRVTTPVLPNPLEGAIYLGSQDANPFGSLIAMYLVAEDPVSGVLLKIPGEVALNPENGQITASFRGLPDLPFEDAELHFFGGARAPLSTPSHCGTYTSTSSFVPWSGNPPATPASSFQITSGPNGAPCPGSSLPFAPSLEAGSPNINAGAFSTLTTTIGREDGNQDIQSVQLHLAPGMSGMLAGVPLCPEAQANAGTCPAASQIGETIVSVGLGGDPYSVTGGKVYLTEKYAGAPFGLSIVNPAKAGPFDLGQVIVRAKIEVDPNTAQLTITTDSSGPFAIPHILDGIPLQIKHVNVTINRPGFTFNPTSCNPMAITATINSSEASSAPVSVPFQVTNCAALKFAPSISFSTSGKTSKQGGADLITKLTYPSAPQGTYANIGYVKVELPKALPSRLTTLQKACTDAQFEANPAGCPPESEVGFATVRTPLLPVPLTGPAIFVSHGGEAFPSLTMVLQGYGVTVDLVGTTFISKAGVTSTTFKKVPDVPFSKFELVLPQGPFSALTANENLCTHTLVIPNEFVSQAGGAPLEQDSAISVTGCAPAITVVSHKVRGKTATVVVSVPSAGKLVATGKGLSKGVGRSNKAGVVTVKLTLTNGEAVALAKHKGRRLKAKINLSFTPTKGKKLKTATTVIVG